jgi:Acyl-CoA dehydrogenase, C-terminal domain
VIAEDELVMLASSFEAAMRQHGDSAAADEALHELGWFDLLEAAPRQGAAAAFAVLGATGAAATLLDDVVAVALGLSPSAGVCVVFPAPHRSDPPGATVGDVVLVDGLVSARIDRATTALVAVGGSPTTFVNVELSALGDTTGAALDPSTLYRRVGPVELPAAAMAVAEVPGEWHDAVVAARAALAHQLIAQSREMLEAARLHAVDRQQFGRPIGSFQAVRHKLAESLAAIEAAAAVAVDCGDGCDPLLATVAKSLAGKAARTTATHAQQVLAGIGFTTDHPFHLMLKRTMVLDTLFGSARTLPSEIGRALLAERAAPRLVEL